MKFVRELENLLQKWLKCAILTVIIPLLAKILGGPCSYSTGHQSSGLYPYNIRPSFTNRLYPPIQFNCVSLHTGGLGEKKKLPRPQVSSSVQGYMYKRFSLGFSL